MKKKIYSAVIVLSLAVPALAAATDENKAEVNGTVELGVRGVGTNGDKARFQEFRDAREGFIGGMQVDALKGAYHLELDALNPGADDQSFQLKGGEYGNFKYKFNYNEMTHNYGFDAITPYTGIGTQTLVRVATPTDTSTWTKFDYAVDHKSYGGELELSLHSPFYVTFGAEKREQTGLRPYSALTYRNGGTRNYVELPEPISNSTDNLNMKAGYLGESITASVSGTLSSFKNDNKYFQGNFETFTNTASDNNVVLAPDNDYYRIAGDLSWRDLPLGSTLATGLSHANLNNSFSATDVYGANTATILAATPFSGALNRTTFDGDIDYTNASIVLSSHPLDKLDTKIYYNYLERNNKSSFISYGAASALTNNAKELLSYEKNTAGIDLGYRLPNKNKLEAGYEYLKIDRSTALPAYTAAGNFYRYANPESTTDDSVYVGLKNSALDWLTAKIRYKRLERNSDLNIDGVVAPTIYTTRFDATDKTMDEWKLSFDFYPVDSLDLGVNYTYAHNDYDWNNSSRNDDKRQNVYFDATWRAAKAFSLNGFVGFEKTDIDVNHRTTLALTPDRAEKTHDDFWTYGLAANLEATDKLTLNLSWQYEKSDGAVDFTQLAATTYTNVTESDDYTKKRLEAKAIYAIDPKLKMTLGYLYEKLDYSDQGYLNYTNLVAGGGPNGDYLSGLYANPNYEANIGYVMVAYGF